ncbi:MAG: ATP-binding protein [Clostridia bacterium]|nr:ATP-binding protein [Clostridia bacterium]
MNTDRIPRRVLGTLLSSVSAGVVPRTGGPYIAIGRVDEIASLADDLNRVADGEGATRFIIGRYGSGKSFLIQLMRGFAADRGFVTADCDLSPERRLSGAGGLATYRELIRNLSCKSSPDGGALPAIIGRWYSEIAERVASEGIPHTSSIFAARVSAEIIADSRSLETGVGGFDFALVVSEYCKAYGEGDDAKMSACLRWLRGEYGTKTEARAAIGIRSLSVINDANWYDHMKLICALVRKVGYKGLCIFIDEGVNLYKISNRISREANYEKILSMYNDTMQGKAEGLMLIFGGTPQFLEDTRRGLFSYEALRSRLCDSRFVSGENGTPLKSMMGPVIRLKRLSDSELLALMMRLTSLHSKYHGVEARITDDEMAEFLKNSLSRAGAEEMITPREIIRDYVSLLDLLLQNPDKSYRDIVGKKAESTLKEEASSKPESDNDTPPTSSGYTPRKVTIDDIVF